MTTPKTPKKEADYGPGKEESHCGGCVHFLPESDPFAPGTCSLVAGGILWYRWCKFWTGKEDLGGD